jgi:hypothetical protein
MAVMYYTTSQLTGQEYAVLHRRRRMPALLIKGEGTESRPLLPFSRQSTERPVDHEDVNKALGPEVDTDSPILGFPIDSCFLAL